MKRSPYFNAVRWSLKLLMPTLAQVPEPPIGAFLDVGGLEAREISAEVSKGALFRVPTEKVAFGYGFRHTPDCHPWVAALVVGGSSGQEGLRSFYRAFSPRSFMEAWYPTVGAWGEHRGQLRVHPWPWTLDAPPAVEDQFAPPEFRAGMVTGRLGPLSANQVQYEWKRLRAVQLTVKHFGFRVGHDDLIAGHFLVDDDEWLFVVEQGQHRAAVLAAKGDSSIPVRVARPSKGAVWASTVANPVSRAAARACLDPIGLERRRQLVIQAFDQT